MFVLSALDADINGAPAFWVEGNWKPGSNIGDAPAGSIPSVPFDKCDVVHEYDARLGTLPNLQGWTPSGSGFSAGHYNMLGTRALSIDTQGNNQSFWRRDTQIARPARIAAYAVFSIDEVESGSEAGEGFDMVVEANTGGDEFKGLRAAWGDPGSLDGSPAEFQYIPLESPTLGDDFKNIKSTQPIDQIRSVWHRMSLQGKFDITKTIESLDDSINYEELTFFGDSEADGPSLATFRADFGATKSPGPVVGRLRNFVASGPGRFIRAWFRAFALSTNPKLRLVLVADALPAGETATQVEFRVRYQTLADLDDPFAMPVNAKIATVNITSPEQVFILEFTLDNTGLEAGSGTDPIDASHPLRFTVERTNSTANDPRRSTVHLLQVILIP